MHHMAVVVDVPEQVLARKLLAGVQDPREERIAQPQVLFLAGLGAELELQAVAVDADVFVVQRRDPVRLVLPLVLLVADADQRLVHQPHRGREHLLAREPIAERSASMRRRNPGSAAPNAPMPVVLRRVAHSAEQRVVPILLARFRITSGREDVTVGDRADPHVRPRGRDADRVDPALLVGIVDQRAIGAEIPPRVRLTPRVIAGIASFT